MRPDSWPSLASISFTVAKDGAGAGIGSNANPSVFGQPVTFTSFVSVALPGSGTPTGTVTFTNQTTSQVLGTATISGGQATFTTSALPVTVAVKATGCPNTLEFGDDVSVVVVAVCACAAPNEKNNVAQARAAAPTMRRSFGRTPGAHNTFALSSSANAPRSTCHAVFT